MTTTNLDAIPRQLQLQQTMAHPAILATDKLVFSESGWPSMTHLLNPLCDVLCLKLCSSRPCLPQCRNCQSLTIFLACPMALLMPRCRAVSPRKWGQASGRRCIAYVSIPLRIQLNPVWVIGLCRHPWPLKVSSQKAERQNEAPGSHRAIDSCSHGSEDMMGNERGGLAGVEGWG